MQPFQYVCSTRIKSTTPLPPNSMLKMAPSEEVELHVGLTKVPDGLHGPLYKPEALGKTPAFTSAREATFSVVSAASLCWRPMLAIQTQSGFQLRKLLGHFSGQVGRTKALTIFAKILVLSRIFLSKTTQNERKPHLNAKTRAVYTVDGKEHIKNNNNGN